MTDALDDESLLSHLNILLGTSQPGATMHHLHVTSQAPPTVGPLGRVPGATASAVYAIDHAGPGDVPGFIEQVIRTARLDAARQGRRAVFAALGYEAWSLLPDTAVDDRVRELAAAQRLQDHPAAFELTMVYAAHTDGRRWTGQRWLTGPLAGTTEDAVMLIGPVSVGEGGPLGAAVRACVR